MLTIRQLYIRLEDGLSLQEALQASKATGETLLHFVHEGHAAPTHWPIDGVLLLALSAATRSRDITLLQNLRERLKGFLDLDLTVKQLHDALEKNPQPLIVLVRNPDRAGAYDDHVFDQRALRKVMRTGNQCKAHLYDLARIAVDFYLRIDDVAAARNRSQLTEGVQNA